MECCSLAGGENGEGKREMGVLREEEERDWDLGDVRRERIKERACECFFRIIIIYGNATVLPNALGSTVAFLIYREYVGKLL
jgi:hypothetical protein